MKRVVKQSVPRGQDVFDKANAAKLLGMIQSMSREDLVGLCLGLYVLSQRPEVPEALQGAGYELSRDFHVAG